MKSKTILSCGTLFIAFAVLLSSNNEEPASEPKFSSVKSVVKKISTSVNVTTVTRPEEALQYDDRQAYEAKLHSLLEEMPTPNRATEPRADAQNQIHGLQSDEFMEGHILAKLRKLSLENEKFIASSQTVYASCAERPDLAPSVRAVCFMRAMEISIKLNNPQLIVDLNVPADVRRLALQLVN